MDTSRDMPPGVQLHVQQHSADLSLSEKVAHYFLDYCARYGGNRYGGNPSLVWQPGYNRYSFQYDKPACMIGSVADSQWSSFRGKVSAEVSQMIDPNGDKMSVFSAVVFMIFTLNLKKGGLLFTLPFHVKCACIFVILVPSIVCGLHRSWQNRKHDTNVQIACEDFQRELQGSFTVQYYVERKTSHLSFVKTVRCVIIDQAEINQAEAPAGGQMRSASPEGVLCRLKRKFFNMRTACAFF